MFLSTASPAVASLASTASIALKTNCTIYECAVRWLQLHTPYILDEGKGGFKKLGALKVTEIKAVSCT